MKQLTDNIAYLKGHESDMGLFGMAARKILDAAISSDMLNSLDLIHQTSRLIDIHTSGVQNHQGFYDEFIRLSPKTWAAYEGLKADLNKQHALAEKLYLGRTRTDGFALLRFCDLSRDIAHAVVSMHVRDNVPFHTTFTDIDFQTLLINHADENGIKHLAERFLNITERVNLSTAIRESGGESRIKKDKAKHDLYAKLVRPYGERTMAGLVRWVLTVIPSEYDAARDNIPHDEYINHYLEMCDQPLDYDDTPQRELIKELNAASTLRFTNMDGTDVSMSLIDHDGTHFTFCNSTNKRNVPGSEAFSAPRRDSVNGVIVAKGKHPLRGDSAKTIEDLTMWFEQGKIVKFSCKTADQEKLFQSYLDRDPNNYFVGEIGIGTNPYLKAHVANTLLVEKIGGQFHVALGTCYTMTNYIGDPVHVNNGNHTENGDHWDIATMLYGRGGKIYADDRLIMDDGKFIDPKYAILNDGWAAVPENQRPPHRKDLTQVTVRFERGLEKITVIPAKGA